MQNLSQETSYYKPPWRRFIRKHQKAPKTTKNNQKTQKQRQTKNKKKQKQTQTKKKKTKRKHQKRFLVSFLFPNGSWAASGAPGELDGSFWCWHRHHECGRSGWRWWFWGRRWGVGFDMFDREFWGFHVFFFFFNILYFGSNGGISFMFLLASTGGMYVVLVGGLSRVVLFVGGVEVVIGLLRAFFKGALLVTVIQGLILCL